MLPPLPPKGKDKPSLAQFCPLVGTCELPMPLFVEVVLTVLTGLCVLDCTEEIKASMNSIEWTLCTQQAKPTPREVCPVSVRRWQPAAVV